MVTGSLLLAAPDPALDPWFARELLRLQRAAYRREAQLVGNDRLPPLQHDEVTLPAWRGRYLVSWRGVHLVGAIAWRDHGDHLDIDRLMVDPDAHRQGIGTTLLQAVLERADGRPVVVSTGRDNEPGLSLYARNGFVADADEQVPPGIWVTRLRWAQS